MDAVSSSRIFISGLPPSFTDVQLRNHFSRFETTDAKVVPGRRIGFVGLKTPELARQAVKYFNKSFVGMARLRVELADPIKSGSDSRSRHNAAAKTNDGHGGEDAEPVAAGVKRKRVELLNGEASGENPKLKEYLDTMLATSKARTWANEDSALEASKHPPRSDLVAAAAQNDEDDEYQVILKKRKTDETNLPVELEQPEADEQKLVAQQSTSEHLEISTGAENTATTQPEDSNEPEAPVSDADWLRSKTNRLLGLVEDDEMDVAKGVAPQPQRVAPPVHSGTNAETQTVDGSQIHDEEKGEDESPDADAEAINKTGRLFLRNLAYSVEESELRNCFSSFGKLEEVHVPKNVRTGQGKGFAYIQFTEPTSAIEAFRKLDGSDFEGRLLHILPADAKKQTGLDDVAISKLPLKKQKEIQRKREASKSTWSWNSMYMNPDAVMSAVAERYGVSKSELLDPTSADAAVKQAHAETSVIQETKAYFASNGVDLEAFKKRERDDRTILVKNFPYGTKASDLKVLFEEHGLISKFIMPPTGTIAIVEFAQGFEAGNAFKSLAYRKIGNSILFLEKAPKDLFTDKAIAVPQNSTAANSKPSALDLLQTEETHNLGTSTLFVRNLNFSTTTERLREEFMGLDGFASARVKTKPDPKHPGKTLSMGFGFLEFKTKEQAEAALAAMNGHRLENHNLVIKPSHRSVDAAEERRKEDVAKKIAAKRTKIIIKNLPFEATKKDVQSLLRSYGQLRSVRVPKKHDRTARGFAFAEFVTPKEAENAIEALSDTHLLGRRLVFEFATGDVVDPEAEIEKMSKKVSRQMEKVTIQQITGVGRKKFRVDGQDEMED